MTEEFRVFGPPGTGKTTMLGTWISQAAERYGSDAILVASFTRAAASELVRRNLPLDPSHVGTLHALCYRALGAPQIAETKASEFNEAQTHYKLSGGRFDLDEPNVAFVSDSDKLMNSYQVARATMTHRDAWTREVRAFAAAWEGWKWDTGYIDFTDMIEIALDERMAPPFGSTIGFFDEVQDFTPLELALVRNWGEQMDFIVLAGDDDQCIYQFKGATPDAFLTPPADDVHKRILRQSYRIPASVHRLSQKWISGVRERELKEFSPRDSEGSVERREELTWRYGAEAIAKELEHAGDVMVIASCSYQIAPIVANLREAGIPFHNPFRRKRGDWNPLKSGRGMATGERIASLLSPTWTYGDLASWMPMTRKKSNQNPGRWAELIADQPEDRIVSVALLGQVFQPGVIDEIRREPLTWLQENVLAAKSKAIEFPIRVIERYGVKALTETPRIVVGTIHSVKGGEADSVYLFPDLSPSGYAQWEAGDDSVRRMFYVGMTRPRERLVVCGQSTPHAVQL